MSLLTEEERAEVRKLEEGSYYGQIGITIRFGNHFWHECSGSLLAGACGGDNLPTLLQVRKRKKTSTGPDVRKRATAVLDRCGNNWKNGKGGCGIMMNEESTPCLATMFQPFVLLTKGHNKGEENATNETDTSTGN